MFIKSFINCVNFFQVDSKAKPAFPRQTSVWWFDCKSAQNTPTLGLSADLRGPVHVDDDSGSNSNGDEYTLPAYNHPRQPVTINHNEPAAGLSSNRFEINKEAEFVSEKALRGHQNPEERFLTHESEHELHEHDGTYTNPHRKNLKNPESEEREGGKHNVNVTSSSKSQFSFNYFHFITILAIFTIFSSQF